MYTLLQQDGIPKKNGVKLIWSIWYMVQKIMDGAVLILYSESTQKKQNRHITPSQNLQKKTFITHSSIDIT